MCGFISILLPKPPYVDYYSFILSLEISIPYCILLQNCFDFSVAWHVKF